MSVEIRRLQEQVRQLTVENMRLRGIIADQDQRRIRDLQRRAEHNEQMRIQLDRLRESQDMLARELQAGRP